jgi:cardiolipin synthase
MLRRNLPLAVLASCLFLIAGCSGGGSANVPSVTALTLSSNTVAFAPQVTGTSASPSTVTLTNAGNTPVSFTSIVLASTIGQTSFSLTSTCSTTVPLPAGSSCTLTFGFAPTVAFAFTATVTITDNVPSSPQTITLTGTGTPPPAPAIAFSPGPLTFTATSVGTPSATQSIAITNTGTAALTLSSIAITGTGASSYSQTNSCPASLPATTGNCMVFVTFTPTTTGTLTAAVSVADNATGSPQSVALTGTGVAPAVTLTASNLTFTSPLNVATAPQSITLTNTGTDTLKITGIALGGGDASSFGMTTSTSPCGITLIPGSSCVVSAIFTPTAATNYAATITITDNAANSPQIITLNGTGTSTAPTVTHTLITFGIGYNLDATPLYTLINTATKTIDMTMYELQDTTFTGDLEALCAKGVKVRVLLDASLVKSNNTPAYNLLNTGNANCSAVFSNTAFQATHQKTITIDGTTTAIMSLNLQTQYYSTTRDFALVENDPADIAAIQATFNADYAAGTPYGGTQGTSDKTSYTPGAGTGLIWSPTTAQADMLALINNAQSTVLLENEEMGAANIVSALEVACGRGVTVHIAMVNSSTKSPFSDYATQFKALEAAGCGVKTWPDTTTGLYIHAKAVVADYGLPTQSVYMGSINYSTASMTENRELGVYITDPTSVTTLYNVMTADYAGATTF